MFSLVFWKPSAFPSLDSLSATVCKRLTIGPTLFEKKIAL